MTPVHDVKSKSEKQNDLEEKKERAVVEVQCVYQVYNITWPT